MLTVYPSGTGDGNGDEATDGTDIQKFVDSIIADRSPSPEYCAFDLNADGMVDMADLPLFVAALLEL